MIFALCQGVKHQIHLSPCWNLLIDNLMQQIIQQNNVTDLNNFTYIRRCL
jgi:hypothetical protein